MDYTVGQQLHGWEITSIREIDEIKATMISLTHIKTKGEMIFLKRDEKNMTFSVTMKTLPKDDTGIFHILEHSTLGGSQKYPVKEPFVELLKSSMNTFLNAITFADKTMYPVSSQTPKDFLNLVEVYLDAVFAPSVLVNKDIFLQEGWHYELLNQEDTPIYKGVVFNEMKGAYTSVDTYIENGMNKLLFADNCYQYESGGYPASIPSLTYESFVKQHDQYYSMTNARFFLDGDAPLEEVLALIEEYANKEEYIEMNATINKQEEKTGLFNTIQYPIDEKEDKAGKAMISFGKIACDFDEIEKIYAYKILCNYLCSSNDSPIKKAILDSNLAQDVNLDLYDGIKQPWLSLTVRYTDSSKLDTIKEAIIQALKDELAKGLDHKIIEANLSYLEFKAKEKGNSSFPEGLSYNINVLDSWLYGGDPALFLEVNDTFKSLRKKLVQGYFEALIQGFLDHKDYTATLVVEPSTTLTKEMEEDEANRIQTIAASWDKETKEKIIQENQHLLAWQQSIDTQEQLDTMPKLTLEDISSDVEKVESTQTTYKDVPIVKYQFNTNGITYLRLYFSVASLKQEDFAKLALFSSLLGDTPTEKYNVIDLQTETKSVFGAFSTSLSAFDEIGNTKECKPYFVVRCSFLDENKQKAYDLIEEVLLHTIFDQKKIKDLYVQMETALQQSVMMSGHSYGTKHILASHLAKDTIAELTGGYTFYMYLKEFNKNFDQNIQGLVDYFKGLASIFTTGNLTVTYNGESDVTSFIDQLAISNRHEEKMTIELLPSTNETIKVPTQISYATLGGNIYEMGDYHFGAMKVLSKIVTLEYLWNEIRVKGGAYGCGLQASMSGDISFYSYRDPSAVKSIETFKKTKEFVEKYCQDKENVDKFIISTIADEAILSIGGKMALGDRNYFMNIPYEQELKMRKDTLSTTVEDILSAVNDLEKIIELNHTCVIGNE